MSSSNKDTFISFYPILIYFRFICLIALAKISSTMSNRSGKSGHTLVLFLILEKQLSTI